MRILKKQDLEDLLFIDIETAPATEELEKDTPLWDAWEYNCKKNKIEDVAGSFKDQAALYAEFGKIICITIGIIRGGRIRLKTFSGDERSLLEEFNLMLQIIVNNKTWLCGHVITGFDAPYIMKRCLVHGLELNILFDVAHIKPWETSYLDTAILWKGTSFKISTLVSLTACLGIPSPKEEFSGADIGGLFYAGELDKIIKYCERDVVAVINIVCRLRGEELLEIAEPEAGPEPQGILTYLFNGGEYTEQVEEKLRAAFTKLSKTRQKQALEILNAIPTKAKGKETDLTKKHIKELICKS